MEEYAYQLAKHLRRLGLDAVALDTEWSSSSVKVENISGAEVVRIPVKPPTLNFKRNIIMEILFGRAVSKYLNSQSFDIVHASTAWAGFILAISKTRRFVYTCHNPLWPEDKVYLDERVVRLVESYAMRSSDAVVALNKTMYRAIVEKARVKNNKVVIVPNGVDTDFFKPRLRGDDVLKKFSLEEQGYILFVGRVSPEKGVHLLLKAFKQVIGKVTRDVKLAIVGPLTSSFTSRGVSPYTEVLVKYARKKLPGKVVFTGPASKDMLRILYSNAYCLVLPSLAEAFAMVILEAMASGTPPIGSTAGGTPDIIADRVNGLLFRKEDQEDLARKILMLIEDKALRNKLAANARKTAEENYSWHVVASRIKEVYARIAT